MIIGDEPAMPITVLAEKDGKPMIRKWDGLTIRQYFSAVAMQGILSMNGSDLLLKSQVAENAVEYADALIIELNKK